MKNLIIGVMFVLSGCVDKIQDDDIVLIVDSVLGSTVHLATFNGNSFGKIEDCLLISKLLSEKYSRTYKCATYKDIKSLIEK